MEVAGRQAAVPLADVLRIEQLPLSRIEYIGYRPVLNFEGQLLPVEDSGGVLAAAQRQSRSAQIIVVVCREGNRQVGIAVSHVLDVAAGGDLFEAGTGAADRRRDAAEGSRDGSRRSGRRGAACRRSRQAREEWSADRRRQWHEQRRQRIASQREVRRRWSKIARCAWARRMFGVPITHILEIVGSARPQPVPLAPGYVGGLVHYRGDVLTTVSLRQLLGLPPQEGRRTSWCWRATAAVSACWWIRWARC